MDTALLIANLSSTPGLLRRLTEDVSPEQATGPPKPGEWSIAEVVRHLADGDRDTFLPRLRRMLAEDRPVFESRPREASADPLNLPTLLTVFESARSEAVKILNGLEPHAWLREGMSPSRGAVSVEAHAATMAAHDVEHLGQIHQIRSALGLRPKRAEARVALSIREVVGALEPVSQRIEALCHGLSAEQLRQRPREGEWSMKEVMAHLLTVERDVFFPRLKRIVAEERPRLERFDPDARAAERDHRQGDFWADLHEFAHARGSTVSFLLSLPAEAPDRIGVSAVFGPVSLATYATHIVDHDLEHPAQLEACRAAVGHRGPVPV